MELNNMREEQMKMNKANTDKMEEFNQKLKEKNANMNKFELGDNFIDNNFDDKLKNLEKKIESLNEVAKKISELNEQNQDKVNNDIKEINDWMNKFHEQVQNNLNNLKNYIDKKINRLSSS